MKVLCMGETLLRYSTQKGHRISELDFQVHVGGSETNIAVSLAQFGFETTLLTKLPHHALGDAVISFLKRFGVDTTKIIRNDMRIGSYFLENGSGNRSSQVIYDRQYSAMTSFSLNDIKLEELFLDVDVFVVSGITAALNQSVREAIIEMLRYCRGNKITVVYDSNYRAKMWSIEEAGAALKEILPYVDILSAGYLDEQLLWKTQDAATCIGFIKSYLRMVVLGEGEFYGIAFLAAALIFAVRLLWVWARKRRNDFIL